MFKGGHPRFNEHLGTFAVIFPANRGHSGDEKMRYLCQQGSSYYMYGRSSTKINNDILLILRIFQQVSNFYTKIKYNIYLICFIIHIYRTSTFYGNKSAQKIIKL